jgi:uncharacterized protein with FMN-binding domain
MKKIIRVTRIIFIGLYVCVLTACSPDEPEIAIDPDAAYADGEYTATGEYGGGPSYITVTVRLTDGIISNTALQTHATDPTSLDYQRRFSAAVPDVVNGKHISEVRVGRLGGSSTTPNGFNDAIRQIREQALVQ